MSQGNVKPVYPLQDRVNLGHILFILALFIASTSNSPLFATSIVLALWGSSLIISAGIQNGKKE